MYPAISDLINDVFGTHISLPIQTYGFFVAVAYLIGTWVLRNELKIKEKKGLMQSNTKKVLVGAPATVQELIILGLISLVLGYKFSGMIIQYGQFSSDPQGYLLSTQGSIWGGIVVAAAFVFYRWYSKHKKKLEKPVWEEIQVHPYEQAGTILIIAAIAGILGAKIFHNLENFGDLIKDPMGQIFSFMGLTFYGGLILGSAAVIFYARRQKMGAIHLLDAAAPGIAISYGVGRLGCMMAGDGCWGIPNLNLKPGWLSWLPDWMWAYDFPHNVVNEGIGIDHCTGKYCTVLEQAVYPTSFYDFVIMTIFFVVLILIRNKIKIPGYMISILVIFMGIQRFFLEKIRVNNKYDIFGYGITQAEIISIVLVILGCFGLWYFRKRYLAKKNSA
jgi:phosphatidylglycerol---prolipoprotein diacylglyceryl transferase